MNLLVVQAEIILTGVASTGAQLSEDTYFDDVQVLGFNSLVLSQITDVNNNEILKLLSTASAVNWIEIINSATGNNPNIQAEGEANRGITFKDSNSNEVLRLFPVASAVNNLAIVNQATGNAPYLRSEGEANTGIDFFDSNLNELLKLSSIASAVNYIEILNTASGINPEIVARGEANLGLTIKDTNGAGLLLLVSVASAVNRLVVFNAATGAPVNIIADGTDTNIGITIEPKGTGVLKTKGQRVHGMVVLDTPDLLASGSANVGTWTQIDMTTAYAQAATDGAVAAEILAYLKFSNTSAGTTSEGNIAIQKNGLGGAVTNAKKVAVTSAHRDGGDTGSPSTATIAAKTITLDTNSDLEYQVASTGTSLTWEIYLTKYYV